MRTIRVSIPVSLLISTAVSLAITIGMFFVQPSFGVQIWVLVKESYGLTFILNWLPVWIVLLLLFCLTNQLILSCGLVSLVCAVLAIVNRYMVAMRYAPLRPFDLLLGAEFLGIAKSIRPIIFIVIGAGLAALVLLTGFCAYAIRNKPLRLPIRIISLGGCLGLMFLGNRLLYANKGLYAFLPYQGSEYNDTTFYQSRGFLYSFLYTLNTTRIDKPLHYDTYIDLIEAAESAEKDVRQAVVTPNIIMVLSEAFSEMPLSPYIDFAGYIDPMHYYKALKEESISGYLLVPHVGGGTADTEFDIYTGINSRQFKGVPYAFTMITAPFPGFPSILKSMGYVMQGIHPGAGWFYRREYVYPLLGIDAFMDYTAFDVNDSKGKYIAEAQTIDKIISEYRRHLTDFPGQPYFAACVTIQNHGPYAGKYRSATNFNTSLSLSADERDILSNYFEGVADCDYGLHRLTEYLRGVEEPTLLVYYGDHLPSLPPSLYDALTPPRQDPLRNYITPFLIWANEAAAELIDTAAFREASLPEDGLISAHYLGAAVLELIGADGMDPFMDKLNELRRTYPVVLENAYLTSDGVLREMDPAEDEAIELYRSWSYYRIRN